MWEMPELLLYFSTAACWLVLSGVAPIPWVLESPEALDSATPLPGTAYKVQIARALVRRAGEALA